MNDGITYSSFPPPLSPPSPSSWASSSSSSFSCLYHKPRDPNRRCLPPRHLLLQNWGHSPHHRFLSCLRLPPIPPNHHHRRRRHHHHPLHHRCSTPSLPRRNVPRFGHALGALDVVPVVYRERVPAQERRLLLEDRQNPLRSAYCHLGLLDETRRRLSRKIRTNWQNRHFHY